MKVIEQMQYVFMMCNCNDDFHPIGSVGWSRSSTDDGCCRGTSRSTCNRHPLQADTRNQEPCEILENGSSSRDFGVGVSGISLLQETKQRHSCRSTTQGAGHAGGYCRLRCMCHGHAGLHVPGHDRRRERFVEWWLAVSPSPTSESDDARS